MTVALTCVLVVIAAFHLCWALGLWVPFETEKQLAKAVYGVPAARQMPGPVPCALVTVALLFAAAWPWFPTGPLRTAGLAVLTLVFLGRGTVAFLPFWRRLAPTEPFATLDQRLYGPLCLGLGIVFALHLIGALS